MNKVQMRTDIKKLLMGFSQEDRIAKSKAACQNFTGTSQYNDSSVIMVFLSLPHEVDTAGIILDAWQKGKTVAVPKVSWQQRNMIAVELSSLESGLPVGSNGLRNPTSGVPVPVEDIDVVVTPGLGFDTDGGRIGRGGGYYDRFFAAKGLKAVKIGFGFQDQVLDEVPMMEHDQKLDMLVTDKEVVVIN